MILPVSIPNSERSTLSVFTPPDEREVELFEPEGVKEQAERVARGYARRKNRGIDKAFVDECIAEAVFTVVYLMWTEWEAIKERYPDKTERDTFFRMSVGYKLKAYFCQRATSSVSDLRKKGIEIRREKLHESHIIQRIGPMDIAICFEDVCDNELEKRVIEYYALGQMPAIIAVRCGISEKRAKKIINKIRRKLRFPMV